MRSRIGLIASFRADDGIRLAKSPVSPMATLLEVRVKRMENQRFQSLDAVRGLAAIAVLLHHLMLSIPGVDALIWADPAADRHFTTSWPNVITYSPLHLFWSGHEAVLIFFTLSGFVLTLAIQAGHDDYWQYLIKRFARIWLPFAASLVLALLLWSLTSRTMLAPIVSVWLHDVATFQIAPLPLLGHFFMTGLRGQLYLNPVMWSLVHEMRISLIMPAIVYLAARHPRLAGGGGAACLCMAFAFPIAFKLEASSIAGSLMQTALYIPLFIAGSWLAIHRAEISGKIAALPAIKVAALWLFAIILLQSRWLIIDEDIPTYLATGTGAALTIALAFGSPKSEGFLQKPAFVWLGTISYSLYLVHMPLMIFLAKLATNRTNLPLLLIGMAAGSLAFSFIFHRLVERKAKLVGRLVAQRQRSKALQ